MRWLIFVFIYFLLKFGYVGYWFQMEVNFGGDNDWLYLWNIIGFYFMGIAYAFLCGDDYIRIGDWANYKY